MAAIKLSNGHEIERGDKQTDPGGAANGRQKKSAGGDAWMKERVEETQEERSAIDDFGVGRIGEAGNKLGVEDAVEERWNREKETDERAGSADIEEGAVCEDGRANQDEGAEGAVEIGEGNEKGIGGANMMVTAGKIMAELVGEKNGEQGESKGQAGGETERVFVKKSKRAEEFVEGEGLVLSIRCGELCARDEAGAEREEEQDASED